MGRKKGGCLFLLRVKEQPSRDKRDLLLLFAEDGQFTDFSHIPSSP